MQLEMQLESTTQALQQQHEQGQHREAQLLEQLEATQRQSDDRVRQVGFSAPMMMRFLMYTCTYDLCGVGHLKPCMISIYLHN